MSKMIHEMCQAALERWVCLVDDVQDTVGRPAQAET